MTNTHAVLLLGPRAPEGMAIAMRRVEIAPIDLSDEASEVHLPEEQAWRVAKALKDNGGFDVAVVPLEGREKQLLLCDMDSTIVGEETLDELAEAFGFGREVAKVTDKAMRGEIAFDEALRARVALFKGLRIDAAAQALRERLTINKGAETLVRTMRKRGARCALVTGGFDIFAAPVADRVGFSETYANRLRSEDGVLSGVVSEPILGPQAKKERLDALCAELSLNTGQVMAVGDGANDRDMIAVAGIGVGYRPKPALEEVANVVLRHADLTALLAIQGIPQSDWSA
ncbi:phosphoserine phosphatase SerB [Parvularcula lutaonensis]|uniref:Phosphoserine phosphatase n=1 Tax=Parvularcula lutaonensis TaxID=491923 RepID=A0ABV7MCJ5_9PROT|nr:phosphoserine phosphatase SerB [Parvularcula lutaonensis]GGY50992.1 phosphoserine phosphatase SerB [Parvularcula lutaonensis]